MSGQIVDASIIAAPRQRNTDEEKRALKEGRIPEGWRAKPKKLAQKDRDARWTLKRAKARPAGEDGSKPRVEIAIPVFGYKNHLSIDRAYGLVRRFTVTDAAAHDGATLASVLDKTNTASSVWADTAYRSRSNEAHLERNGFTSKIHFRRRPGVGLTPSQKRAKEEGEPSTLSGALCGRDGVCRPEAPLRVVRAHHRLGPGTGEDRAGKPGLQLQQAHLAGEEARARGHLRSPHQGFPWTMTSLNHSQP